jgi:2OG-Fe(II) oxygenase superfamily
MCVIIHWAQACCVLNHTTPRSAVVVSLRRPNDSYIGAAGTYFFRLVLNSGVFPVWFFRSRASPLTDYRTHHDYIPHQRTRSCGPRILTFLFYLSDVASGGETNFPDLGLTIQPKKGRAVLFANVMDSGEPTPGKRGVWLFCNVSVFAHRALCVGGVRGSPIIGPLLTSTRNDVPCFCKNRHVIRFGFPTHGSRIVVRSLGGRSADAPPGPAGGNRHQICRQCL